MGSTQAQHSTTIHASAEVCFEAICDYESYPEWQSAVSKVVILERDEKKRGTVVEQTIDIKVKKIRYRLLYHYEGAPHRLHWEYLEGDLKDIIGEYLFKPDGDTTEATFSLEIDPGRFVPGPIKKILVEQVMRSSVDELKKRAEALQQRRN